MLRSLKFSVALVTLVTLAGCHGVVVAPHRSEPVAVVKNPGPPDHAPAHGHRRKHQAGPELRFDSGLGVYIVVDQVDVYFDQNRFIRIRKGVWQVSARLDGPWKIQSAKHVPAGLRSKQHGKKQKHQDRGAAKGKW